MNSELLFLNNTFLYEIPVTITGISEDEYGSFFLTDKTIFYPQGGGQPNDKGYIIDSSTKIEILKGKYGKKATIKHYTLEMLPENYLNKEVIMYIDSYARNINSAFHTVGHWLSQIVNENLGLDLEPSKGHHFAGEAYVEFNGNLDSLTADTLDNIKLAMQIDLQSDLRITSEFATMESPKMKNALLPKNFKPLVDRPLRLVTIEGYKPVPCGGTHYDSLKKIKSVNPKKIYKKGKKVRLTYDCTI